MATDSATQTKPKQRPTERNPITTARFRRQSWWQVIFPIVAATLLMAGLVIWLYLGTGASGASIVADYVLILLLIALFLFGLPFVFILFWLSTQVGRGIQGLPPYANSFQQTMRRVHSTVDRWTNRIAGGVITVRSVLGGINSYLKQRGDEHGASADAPE